MIFRTFNNLKFKRTYIGGSKKHELEMFLKTQGNNDDNSDCNWIEYRKILIQYLDDILNIIFSWKLLFQCLGYTFLLLSVLLATKNLFISIIIFLISIIFQILYLYLKNKINKKLCEYNFALDIVLNEINKQTGLEFNKNYI